MRLWVISDLHLETRLAWQPVRPESFDVLVAAGDVDNDLLRAIETVALIADGKPSVFVAGNHELAFRDASIVDAAGRAAHQFGVTWLERTAVAVDGVRFAGATLWEQGYPAHFESVRSLAAANADVVVTHFPPDQIILLGALRDGGLWICGHHHGHDDMMVDGRRLVRNALGYANESVDGAPAIPDLVVEVRA